MPIPPQPYTLFCKKCGWKKTIKPRSDALALGVDWFSACPRCGAEGLNQRAPNAAELVTVEGRSFLGRIFGRNF